jgi:hypothetical protein
MQQELLRCSRSILQCKCFDSSYSSGTIRIYCFTSPTNTLVQLQQSQQQSDNSEMVCNYIGNLLSGSYDETGEIVIDANSWVFNSSNWRAQGEYLKQYNSLKVKGGQIAGLVITALACVVMWIWACCLHGSLSKKNISWRPRRGKHAYDEELTRATSGIMMGRSRSGPNGPLL